MSIATTVCLPWLVALLMTGPPTMAQIFQWIFIIVTSMQGPTMFICFVIFQEDVLTNLFSLVGKDPPQALLPAKSSKSTKSAASEISSIKPTTAGPVKKVRCSRLICHGRHLNRTQILSHFGIIIMKVIGESNSR